MTKLLEQKVEDREEAHGEEPVVATVVTESVGTILQKKRKSLGISVDDLSKKLKLNRKYITAIEYDEYNALPKGPYMRMYIRSIAQCLHLDPDLIVKQHCDQVTEFQGVAKNAEEKRVAEQKNNQKTSMGAVYSIIIIVALGVIGFWGFQTGWFGYRDYNIDNVIAEDVSTFEESTEAEENDGVVTEEDDEDLVDSTTLTPAVTVDQSTQNSKDTKGDPFLAELARAENLVLTLTVPKDSVWIHLFRDGKSWRNFIYDYRPRTFYAKDSFNIKISSNRDVRCTLNGSELIIPGRGIQYVTFSREGMEIHDKKQWRSIMGKRFNN